MGAPGAASESNTGANGQTGEQGKCKGKAE